MWSIHSWCRLCHLNLSNHNTLGTLETTRGVVGVHHLSAGRAVLHGRIVESTLQAGMTVHLRPKPGLVAATAGAIRLLLADLVGIDAGRVVLVGLLEVVGSNVNPPLTLCALLGEEGVLVAIGHIPVALPTLPRILDGHGFLNAFEELFAVSAATVPCIATDVARGLVGPGPVPWTQLEVTLSMRWTDGWFAGLETFFVMLLDCVVQLGPGILASLGLRSMVWVVDWVQSTIRTSAATNLLPIPGPLTARVTRRFRSDAGEP